MNVEKFVNMLGVDFFVGVPDSQLRPLCDYLMVTYGIDPKHHIIAANEGNCVGIAAGYNLATEKVPVVYMQNSGEGNIINPVTSLINEEVYAIPMIFVIGWRGEPNVKDEPQHVFQGKVTLELLDDLDIAYAIIGNDTSDEVIYGYWKYMQEKMKKGKSVAWIIRKNAFSYTNVAIYHNQNTITREDAIRQIVFYSGKSPIICTTGKASRELYEIRESLGMSHCNDFLNVGSMGHASSIALGFAINKQKHRVWCIDGDGAFLMHMGAAAVIGNVCPENLVHIVINNQAHETVGGMPTVSSSVSLCDVARACGYRYVAKTSSMDELVSELQIICKKEELCFLEICTSIASRADLGRPKSMPIENKKEFQKMFFGDQL